MKLAVCVMKTVLPIMTQCALRMGQHMTTNAGMSCTTVEDWRIIWCITQEAVRVRMTEVSVKFNNRKVCSNLVSQETGVLSNLAPVSMV